MRDLILISLNLALKRNTKFDFRASSVLLIYEGDTSDSLESLHPRMDVRLIDFDHTEIIPESSQTDALNDPSGVRWGVRNLMQLFRKVTRIRNFS